MKKLFLLFIVLTINYSFSFSQTNNVDKIKSLGVKSLITKSYSVDIDNGKRNLLETKRFEFDKNGNVTTVKFDSAGFFNKIAYTYDTKGKMTEEKMYNLSKVVRSYKYDYNKSGKKLYSKSINSTDDVDLEINYTYDDKGKLIKEESVSGNKTFGFKYAYDNNSRKTEMTVYNPTKIEKKFYYYYDDRGLLIEEKGVFYWAGKKEAKHNFFSNKSYKYNDNKELIETDNYIIDQIFEKYLYFYNDKGLLTKWEKYNSDKKFCYVVEYEYE